MQGGDGNSFSDFEIKAEWWGEVTRRGEAVWARTELDERFGNSFCQQEAFA